MDENNKPDKHIILLKETLNKVAEIEEKIEYASRHLYGWPEKDTSPVGRRVLPKDDFFNISGYYLSFINEILGRINPIADRLYNDFADITQDKYK